MKYVKVTDDLPKDIGDYFIRRPDNEGGFHRFHVHWDGEYFFLLGKRIESSLIEWLDESPDDLKVENKKLLQLLEKEMKNIWFIYSPVGFSKEKTEELVNKKWDNFKEQNNL